MKIKIDVTKIPKEMIVERRYTNSQGHEVVVKELSLEVVELRQPKVVKDGDTWTLMKTHFVSLEQTKEQRANKEKSVIIGDGLQFVDKEQSNDKPEDNVTSDGEIDVNEIPF